MFARDQPPAFTLSKKHLYLALYAARTVDDDEAGRTEGKKTLQWEKPIEGPVSHVESWGAGSFERSSARGYSR